MEIRGDSTVNEAKEWLGAQLEDGCACPVCGQHAERYRRTLRAPMVRTMGRMLLAAHQQVKRLGEDTGFRNPLDLEAAPDWADADAIRRWVHLADIPQESRDVATAAYFGLIEQDRDRRGWWRVTFKGAAWLRGRTDVAKYAFIYNGEVRGYGEDRIHVSDVLPRFTLEDLAREDSDDE